MRYEEGGSRRSRRSRLVAIATALAVISAACVAAGAQAAAARMSTIRVSGTYTVYDFGTTTCAPVGGSSALLACTTEGLKSAYEGDLEGSSSVDFSQLIDCRAGRTVGKGVETFSGSIDGNAPGTLRWQIVFASSFDCALFFPFGFHGTGTIMSGSGALSGVMGTLHFGDVTYEGSLLASV